MVVTTGGVSPPQEDSPMISPLASTETWSERTCIILPSPALRGADSCSEPNTLLRPQQARPLTEMENRVV